MSAVRRIFAEKMPGFNIEASHILADLRNNLGMSEITALRLLCRYDIAGLSEDDFSRATNTIFSEPNVDKVYITTFPQTEDETSFAVEPLPGQFDQRADSAAQCVQLLTGGEPPLISCAKVYVISGKLTGEQLDRIKKYIINPVESRKASRKIPKSLEQNYVIPTTVDTLDGFIKWDDAEMNAFYTKNGFAMTLSDLNFCRDYFRDTEQRDPTITEIKVIDTYWSDHCRHTTFLTQLDEISIDESNQAVKQAYDEYLAAREEIYGDEEDKKPICLMDIATVGAKLLRKRGLIPDLDVSEEINACSIEVQAEIDGKTEPWLVQFKNETHNHPTEIEPFGGAATCLGGAIRDPLSGRSYVYQAMRVTGASDPRTSVENTIPGKLPQSKITTTAAAGYSSYGNQIGLATGQVAEIYHPGYAAKRMEIGAVVGASPKSNIVREIPDPGDIIILLGGRTGRDGCGGATGSSKAHTDESLETCGAEVQKGNPPTERKIQRLFRNPNVSRLIKRCNDFGAGGVCVAIGELADGLTVRLDDVRKKYDGLDGTELAISESQERMAVVVDPKDADQFINQSALENLEAYPVAVVTESPRLKMEWNGKTIVDISREFLNTNGVTQHAKVKIITPRYTNYRNNNSQLTTHNSQLFIENLKDLNVCGQKGLVERFGSTVGKATVLTPFGGKYQLTPEEAMVAKLPAEGSTDCATAMSFGYNPFYSEQSPFHGAVWAVVESLSKLAAVGADPLTARLTFQEYFERLRNIPERWGKPAAALLGALTAQLNLGVPSIGGKDSMSGSFNDQNNNELKVPPTLVSFAIAMTSAKHTVSAAFKQAGSRVILLPIPTVKQNNLPDWDNLKKLYKEVFSLCRTGKILAASVVGEGGMAAAIARMSFGNGIGFNFGKLPKDSLYAPDIGSLVLELHEDCDAPDKLDYVFLGETSHDKSITFTGSDVDIKSAQEAWMSTLEPIFPNDTPNQPRMNDIPLYIIREPKSLTYKIAKPRVFIPAFPGTNCEEDTAKTFRMAGAHADVMVFRNLTASDIAESIQKMAEMIRESQIVMLPGGFSAGDEPDGSGKFIATTLRNPMIAEAIADLLQNRDGLILGICNGFQALIKTGLLPYGKITDIKPDDPTLTFNSLGRHVSRMVYTRVTSVKSPWMSGCGAGDVHCIPVCHGEGRFVSKNGPLTDLIKNGQIATQYCDLAGVPSADITWNPNGSLCAIEGITSPDGRVFGKMGHSERTGENLLKNVPGDGDQKLFVSGVRYFS